MLDDLLNTSALTLIVAIAAATACINFDAPRRNDEPTYQSAPAAAASAASSPETAMIYGADASVITMELPAPIVEMPAVVVTGHRETLVEPSVAAAD
jgi:hypothetical protein